MKMQETLKNINNSAVDVLRDIADTVLNRISDPEQIRAFSGHLSECSRTQFLQQSWGTMGAPGLFGPGSLRVVSNTTTCSECHGSIMTKFD